MFKRTIQLYFDKNNVAKTNCWTLLSHNGCKTVCLTLKTVMIAVSWYDEYWWPQKAKRVEEGLKTFLIAFSYSIFVCDFSPWRRRWRCPFLTMTFLSVRRVQRTALQMTSTTTKRRKRTPFTSSASSGPSLSRSPSSSSLRRQKSCCVSGE